MKTIVITGGSRGLGLGLARHYLSQGHRVVTCARSPLSEPVADLEHHRVDVTDAAGVQDFTRRVEDSHGDIHLWVNNAGLLEPISPVRNVAPAEFSRLMEVNLFGVLHGVQAYLGHLERRRVDDPVLVNISSGAALRGYAGWGAYCASKAAVDRLTECVQLEEPHLRAYAVAPGVIDTDMQALIRRQDPSVFPDVPRFLKLKEDNAFSTPEHVADALWAALYDPAQRPAEVVCRLPPPA